ncbi:MAG: GTPase Era [Bacteroidota bacterium]
MTKDNFKSGYVVILGEPNVGKSTLLNSLLHQKLSIVTKKPQTTRHRILGILTEEGYQIIFLDTPGLIEPKYLLQDYMMKIVDSAIDDADILLLMIDATKPMIEPQSPQGTLLERMASVTKTPILVLNKVDRVDKGTLLPIIDQYSKRDVFREIVPVSALTGDNLDDLKQTLAKYLPEQPPYYDSDIVSEHPERFFVSEIIREKAFEELREEVPYAVSVEVLEFKERGEEFDHTRDLDGHTQNDIAVNSRRKDYISAEIYVEKHSQKGILIGRGGRMLKEIGERSRKDIEAFLGRPIFLELHVKVRANWRNDEKWLKRMGY